MHARLSPNQDVEVVTEVVELSKTSIGLVSLYELLTIISCRLIILWHSVM